MAVVKLGNKVKTSLPNTIRYVINPEKNDGGEPRAIPLLPSAGKET